MAYDLSPEELKKACDEFQAVLNNPQAYEEHRNQFIRSAFFDVDGLRKVTEKTQAQYVRIYYGIDPEGKDFMFMAPITPDGSALERDDTVAFTCCCTVPPCPKGSSDRYISE